MQIVLVETLVDQTASQEYKSMLLLALAGHIPLFQSSIWHALHYLKYPATFIS